MIELRELNQTQALILGVLHSGPKNGARIIEIGNQIQDLWSSTRSQIYRELWLLDVEMCIRVSDTPTPRGVKEWYEITDIGRELYAAWAQNNPFGDSVRNPWILRVALARHDGRSMLEIRRAAVAYHQAREMQFAESTGLGNELLRDYHRTCKEFFGG